MRSIAVLRLTVSRYKSAHILDLIFAGGGRAAAMFVLIHPLYYFYFSWEIVFKITFFKIELDNQ